MISILFVLSIIKWKGLYVCEDRYLWNGIGSTNNNEGMTDSKFELF